MNYRIILLISILFFPLHSLSALAPDDEILIGYVTDFSGKGAFLGHQSRAGAELAIDELQKAGKKIKIVFGDHALDTKKSLSETQRMVHFEKVDALLNDFTPTSIAASPVAKKGKKLFIHLSPARSIVESNPYSFRDFLDYEQGCEKVARYWKSKGIEKVGHFKLNLEFGELCLTGSKKVYPDIFVVDYNSGEDIRSSILLMKKKGIEAFFQTAYEIDMLHRLQVMGEIRYQVPVGGPDLLLTELVIEKQGKNLEDATVFGFPEIDQAFVAKLKEKDPNHSMVNIETAGLAYTHMYQLAEALSTCPRRDIDCQVENLKNSKSYSPLSFDGWKDRIAQYDYSLKQWKNGKLKAVQ